MSCSTKRTVTPDDRIENWSDDRIWSELHARLDLAVDPRIMQPRTKIFCIDDGPKPHAYAIFLFYQPRKLLGIVEGSRIAFGAMTLSMPSRDTPRRINGATEEGRSMPPASRIFLQTHVWPMLYREGSVREIHLHLRGREEEQHVLAEGE